jgi:hypothetical protein
MRQAFRHNPIENSRNNREIFAVITRVDDENIPFGRIQLGPNPVNIDLAAELYEIQCGCAGRKA